MDLTNEQLTILTAPEPKIAVCACAASAKTATLIEKARRLLQEGNDPSRIAVITFTRMAAQECIDRLGTDYKEGIFVGTIHALAAHFLALNGLGNHIGKIAEEEDFDKLFELCKNLNIKDSYDWVLVDETQDCGKKELEFIFERINPSHFFVCFDFNQTIYSFRGARPDLLREYLKNAKFYYLTQNFRNGYAILDYARSILLQINAEDTSEAARDESGIIKKLIYNPDFLVSQINTNDSFKDWAILTRTNTQVEQIQTDLELRGIPTITFKQGDITRAQLEKIMSENKVKVLTAHSSKGLAWNNVATYGLNWWKGKDEEYRLNYVAATRARNLLIMMGIPSKKKKKRSWD